MSVVIRDSEGVIKCLCKGADSILFPLLKDCDQNKEVLEVTTKFLEDYANEGLRTLLIVEKIIPQNEYDEWNRKFKEANFAISGREEKID